MTFDKHKQIVSESRLSVKSNTKSKYQNNQEKAKLLINRLENQT